MGNPSERPNWAVWGALPKVKVWQGVALTLDLEPTSIRTDSLESARRLDTWARLGGFQGSIYLPVAAGALILGSGIAREFNQRVAAVMAELDALQPHPKEGDDSPSADSYVCLPMLATWTVRLGWSVPPEFAALAHSSEKAKSQRGSWCISGEAVARDLADAWADLNGLPRGEGPALAYEVQVRRAIDKGIEAGEVRKLSYPLLSPVPEGAAFEDCFFEWDELRAWAAKHLHQEWPVVPPWEKSGNVSAPKVLLDGHNACRESSPIQKRPEIILPHGTSYVTLEEIPGLIASALHPQRRGGRTVSGLRKTSGKFLHSVPLDVELTPEDWEFVRRVRPPYKTGMRESEYVAFAIAFYAAPDKPDWEPIPYCVDGPDAWALTHAEQRERLEETILRGGIVVYTVTGELMTATRGRPEEIQPLGRILAEDFEQYARTLPRPVDVRVDGGSVNGYWPIEAHARLQALEWAREAHDAGEEIDAKALEQEILAGIQKLADEGAIKPRIDAIGTRAKLPGSVDPSWYLTRSDLEVVLQYNRRRGGESKINYLRELLRYRASGRYTLKQAADYIATEGGEDYKRTLARLKAAARNNELPMYRPGVNLKLDYDDIARRARLSTHPRPASVVRDFYEEAYWDNLNAWLEKYEPRITCRFPDPRPARKAVDPPILLAKEGALTPFNQRVAWALNYGKLSAYEEPQPVLLRKEDPPALNDARRRSGSHTGHTPDARPRKQRRDLLDRKIDEAEKMAGGGDAATIFPYLREMALKEEHPIQRSG